MSKLSHSQYEMLIKSAQEGDSSAFATLYAATVESQLYFATAFLKDSALAEDAVQEVYLSLYKNMKRIKDGKLLIAYLHRICYHVCVDFKRKANRQKGELDEETLACQPDNNADNRYVMLEQSSDIYKILATLPDEQRAAFLMRFYDSMKIREIAMALDLSESTIKRYIRAAVNAVKEYLQS